MKSVDTYMTVDGSGRVSFDFEGHISADGIDILAGDNDTPPDDRKIIWHKTTLNGAHVAEVYAFNNPGAATNVNVKAQALDAGEQCSAVLSATSLNGNEGMLSVSQKDTDLQTSSFIRAWLDDGDTNRIIINANRQSSFVQLGGFFAIPGPFSAARYLWSGTGSIVFSAAQSVTGTVTHNFGMTPNVIIMTQKDDQAVAPPVVYQAYNANSTNFTFRAFSHLGPFSATSNYSWLVMN